MLTPRGHTRDVQLVTFRVSAGVRARLERDAAALGVSVNVLAYRRTCEPETAKARVDIGELPPLRNGSARDLTVEYDDAGPNVANGED